MKLQLMVSEQMGHSVCAVITKKKQFLTKILGQHGLLYNGNYGMCIVFMMEMSLMSISMKERISMST